MLHGLGEPGLGAQFLQGLLRRNQDHALQVLTSRQTARQGLCLLRLHLRFEEHRDGRRMLPTIPEHGQIARQHVEGPRQGQGDANHQHRHQGRQWSAPQAGEARPGLLVVQGQPVAKPAPGRRTRHPPWLGP